MRTYSELQEGLQDPNIFKAFFLAGGPGSGKSYVVRYTTGGTGLRVVNSDDVFEKYLDDKRTMSKDVSVWSLMVLVRSTTRYGNRRQT